MYKDKKDIMKKLFKLVNKFLKNEVEEIGSKIYKYFYNLINYPPDKIGEINVRAYTEYLIYLNDNSQRILDIWNINLVSNKNEKKLSRNSLELLGCYSYAILYSYQNFNKIMNINLQNTDYIMDLKVQVNKLLENITRAIKSIKSIEKQEFRNNSKDYLLEKYLFFIIQILYLFYFLKNKNINKEEVDLILYTFYFVLKNTTIPHTYQMTIKYLESVLNIGPTNDNADINQFNTELIRNWKTYLNESNYLQNRYKSDNKYNLIMRFILKYYLYCLNKAGVNNEPIQQFRELYRNIINDNLITFKNIVTKINDFRISLELKGQIIIIIYLFYGLHTKEKKEPKFEDIFFFLKQITSFYHTLFTFTNEFIGSPLRDEKQQQKEIYQKNMLKINVEDDDSNTIQKLNLNRHFLILLSNKYDKYIYIEDPKVLNEFMKSSLNILKSFFIDLCFKPMLNKKENIDNIEMRNHKINRIAVQLSKFFYFFYYVCEKNKMNHQNHESQPDLIDKLLEIYISFPPDLLIPVFKRLMPYILKLYKFGNKISPLKNSISNKLIHNIFKTIKEPKTREILFEIYFEYFSLKIYETGNPAESFNSDPNAPNNASLTESINNITILKSIFFNMLDCVNNFEYFKNKIIPLIIDFLYLSKDAEYYGNYIYILRCFFKYLKTAVNQAQSPPSNPNNPIESNERKQKIELSSNFNYEINYILYAILKYLLNIKEKTPFLSEIISEIIMIMPVKFKFLSEIPHLIFPSLVDSLNNGSENIQLCLSNLENWMNIYVKHPENVVPFIEQNLSKITDFLSSNLLRPLYINVCLVSLKWLSKLGGKGRNYLEKKKIIVKTCPNQILTMKLKEKNSDRSLDFILDNIIDICNNLNSSNKSYHKKNASLNDKNIFYNYIEIYKNCLSAFFHRKIDYDYIIEVKKNIINGINFNESEFNSGYSFKKMNEKNSKIKINSIFRKIEHFLIGKIITGFFLMNATITQSPNNQKDLMNFNDLMNFISNYFLLILLSKEKNNKNMLLFELDPIVIIDEVIHFLFSTHPTIIRNTNIQFTEYSLKIIKNILDSINKFFDYNNNVIKNLEIVDIIYMKLINCCYINEPMKKDSGLMLLKILLQKFDKEVNHKYLKYFFKCISSVTSNYSNIVKIQFKKGSNILVEVIDYLIKMFATNDEDYLKLKEEHFNEEKNKDEEMLPDKEKEIINKEKKSFIMFYDFIKYCFDDIIEKIDSPNNYTRNLGMYLLNKIIGNNPKLKKYVPILFQMDISNLSIIDFFKYYKEANVPLNYKQLIYNCNNNINENIINLSQHNNSKKYILPIFNKTKIYKKLDIIFNALTKKLGLRETKFATLISYSDALINIFNNAPILIEEYIFYNNNDDRNVNLYLDVIKALYYNILISYFNYCEISIYFKDTDGFKTKLIYLFMEQLLVEKNTEYEFKIKDNEGKQIILTNEVKDEYIEYIEKYVYNNDVYRNQVNSRDYLIGELFEYLGLRINMVHQYIKVLNFIFNKLNFDDRYIKAKEEFNKYKIKTTKLIFITIFNLSSSSIIKESSSFLCDTFKKDTKLKEEIYRDKNNYNKINSYIDKINEKDIKESNCAMNQDNDNNVLQKDHINALLIICKCMQLDDKMISEIKKKLTHFEKSLKEVNENSQFVLFFGYISLFLYIDTKEDFLFQIFNQLLLRIKESMLYSVKNLLSFTQTKYHKRIIKLIIKYRQSFSKFILSKTNDKSVHKYLFNLIKCLGRDERSTLICETILCDIANLIKNEIIINENNQNDEEIQRNVNKLTYLLKISKNISLFSPLYLKRTSLIEIIDDYIKNIISKFNNNYEKYQENMNYEKVIKYWLDLNKIHIEIFKNKNKYILSLFYFKSMKNMSNIEKNKIVIFITYRLSLMASDKNSEEKYKSLMNEFIKLDEETIKYFDIYIDYLIMPMMIRYLKNFNYFKCFSVSMNKDNNSLKISPITESKDNKEDNNNTYQAYDEEFLLNTLETLTTRLNEIIFDIEKKEEAKYKLLSLLIVVFLEYIKQKNKDINYNEKTKKIYYTIQTLLAHSPFTLNDECLGIWRIYLLFDIVLFSKQEKREENIKTIYSFYKNLNDDYNEIDLLAYELILPNSQLDNVFEKLFICYYNDGNFTGIFNLLKIFLKFPNIINKTRDSTVKYILNYIYEISPKLTKSTNSFKKIFVQIIGLLITYISKQREYSIKQDNNNLKIKNVSEIEKKLFKATYKLFECIFITNDKNDKNDKNESENLEILKKLTIYLREILNSTNNLPMSVPSIDPKTLDSVKYIHIYIQLLRIYSFNIRIDFIYKNLEFYMKVYKGLIDKNINFRYINDFFFILRLLTDDKLFVQINNNNEKSKSDESIQVSIVEHKIAMHDLIESIIKDRIGMSKKITNYDIKDLFNGNNTGNNTGNNKNNNYCFYESILNRMLNYLILNKYYIDRNLQNLNLNNQHNNIQNNVVYNNNQQQQLQTNYTTVDSQTTTTYQPQQNNNVPVGNNYAAFQQMSNIRNIQQNNASNQYQQQQQQIYNDRWLETFHINDFKFFVLYRKFFDDFYATLPNTFTTVNNINISNVQDNNVGNNNNNNININNIAILKEKLESKLKASKENLDLIHNYTYSFFENFFCFTLFFLREYKAQYEYYYKKGFNVFNTINKEIKEYFLTSHNFYYNLRSFDDLQKIKTEQLDCIINDKDKEKNKIFTPINNMFIIYPDVILSGFLFFFQCKEIVEKYYSYLLELFLYTYRHFRDKFYDPLLEDLLDKIMFNEYLKDKSEEKIDFMFKLLNSVELLCPYKILRTSENILEIFMKYLKKNLNEPNFNKKAPKIFQFLRIFLYNTTKFELSKRKEIFEVIKAYIGNKLIDCLKWIFTLDDDSDFEIFSYIYYESIPLSIDLLLSYFQEKVPLTMNTNNYSRFKYLKKFESEDKDKDKAMEIENNNKDYTEYDKNNYIKNIVESCNAITKEKNIEELLDPIRTIILLDNASYHKIFSVFFPQIWKMLNMNERETLSIYINEFLFKYLAKSKEKNNQIINLLFDTFSSCTPVIYIKPIIMQSLIPYQNFWSTNILYLENLLISGIDVPSTYNSLINIFNSLQEDGLCNGLQYYFAKNNLSKEAFSELQANNYIKAENIFYECFNKLKNNILDKINIENLNFDENTSIILSDEDFETFNDLSSWENGLIECYENNDKWNNIIELSNINNNNDLKLKGLWYYGIDKWKELDAFVKTISQYNKHEKGVKGPYIVQINEIYSTFEKLIEESNINADNNNNNNNNYQNTCMNCIRNIYQDFSALHPKNLESLDYYYFIIFQLAVESWESTNTLNETLKKRFEKKKCNFKDNLLLWRERLPHYCEGIKSLKCILEPRNYLFNTLRTLMNNSEDINDPNNTDKVWTDMIFMKYSRKLNLTETFYDKLKIFEKENKNNLKIYPYEIYCKDIEYIKFIRNNIYNYDLGIKICDECIKNYSSINEEKIKDFIGYVINNFKEHQAYFYYKKGDIIKAHKLFTEASIYKNKESTDYHLYYDWAEMCEEIALLTNGEEESSQWFENTIHNLLYTIIYKLDKAKYIIPRMITFIKKFHNESLKNRFNEEIENIPSWIWIFWLPILFENFNYYYKEDNKNDFFYIILKSVAKQYRQIFYYPFTIYEKIMNEKIDKSEDIIEKYNEIKKIIIAGDKYDHCIEKINIIIDELAKKEKNNQENSLNSILSLCEMLTFKNQKMSEVKIFFDNIAKILRNFPDLIQFRNNIEELMKNSEITRDKLRECVIKNKYYIHNLIVTENKFQKLNLLCEENIHNIDFNNIELPGYFSNKIIEPTEQNIIYISKFESEYSHKFITDARSKVLIKCSNDKLLNFIIVNQDADKNIDMRMYMMQILFNFIFAKNFQTYKRKVCFVTPIKYHISSKIKIVEEDINIKYNMDEIYEYCLQKRGYSPKIANQIFEEEAKKWKVNNDLIYYSSENNEKLFYKMCKIIPQDSLKNFIHKFILTSEDILLFRKQFTISYSINNLLSFIFLDNIILKNISFNKETGFCSFNSDLTLFTDNEYKEIFEQKEGTPLRLTKNISFFLSITSIYGIIPGIFYFSCEALLKKSKVLTSILKICLNNNNDNTKIDKIVNNYMNKFKFVLNMIDEKEYNDNKNLQRDKNDNYISKDSNNNINSSIQESKEENKNQGMKIIHELIENSMNNDNLKKKTIDYEAWF